MKALIVPIDNRPVTYLFPVLLGKIASLEIIAPPREIMGSLTVNTSVNVLNDWLNNSIQKQMPDVLLVCLDSIFYGGLIPSRRTESSLQQILEQAKTITRWKRNLTRPMKVYAQSSIMRISDNYDNTEEKQYWSRYGRELFAWSESLHRLSVARATRDQASTSLRAGELEQLESRIDEKIRRDYLNTRMRNFQLNRKLLDYVNSGEIDFLVFSQDDSGQYGLNVMEKEKLVTETENRKISNVAAYSGADEVVMTLIGRYLIEQNSRTPRFNLVFSPEHGASIASRYEGQTIGQSVSAQLTALGLRSSASDNNGDIDFTVIIHTSGDRQGDHIFLSGQSDLRNINTAAAVAKTIEVLESASGPFILCDVAYANGSDPVLIERLLEKPELLKKLWGYAGWNTTGNTLGCAFATGIARWFAETNGRSQQGQDQLKEALFVRLADDWAYQTQVRNRLGNDLSESNLKALMSAPINRLKSALSIEPGYIELAFPWRRSFEVEINISSALQATR